MKLNLRCFKLFLSALFALAWFNVRAQLTVNMAPPYNSINYLVNNVLLGNSIVATNITYSGDDTAVGFFNGMASNIGLDSGVILCNGTITDAPGPNNNPGTTYSWPNCNLYSDPDLSLIAGGATINDAAIIQFDFVAISDTLRFKYVFGSEEYPEFVGAYDDAFGFFISGPGISGPYTGNAEDVAVIPGTSTPVTINNVNCNTNFAYYVCNWPGACNVACPTSSNMPSTTVQYDGFTVVLTAVAVVQCGQTYHVKLAIGDAGDCAYDSGVFLKAGSFAFNSLHDTLTDVGVKCYGDSTGSATINVTGGTPPYTYAWSPIGGTNATASNLPIGTYTVTVTDAGLCATDTLRDSVTITQPTALTENTSFTGTACGSSTGSALDSVSGGTPGYTYSWSNSATSSSVTGLSMGTYTVTATDANGCMVTSTVNIPGGGGDTVSIASITNVSCNGNSNGSITTTSTGGGTPPYTYSWSPAGGTDSNATGLSAGSYTVTLQDAGGCTSTASATVTQPPALTSHTSFAPAACGSSNGVATDTIGGGTPGYTYSWSNSAISSSITGLTAGTYTVTATDANGCTITASVTVPSASAETITVTNVSGVTCYGDSNGNIITNTAGGTLPYTYNWTPNGGTNANATGLSLGSYTLTVTDANGCIATASATITQPTALTLAAAGFPTSCYGSSTGQATVIPSGGTGAYTYSWSPAGGNNANANNLSAGTYTVTVTDANGCTHDTSVVVTQPAQLRDSISASVNVLCNGGNNGSATAGVTGGTSPYTYSWSPYGGANATASSLTAGSYTVTVHDHNGCTASASVSITQPSALAITDTVSVLCIGQSATLSPNYTGGTPAYTYSWSPATGLSCTACAAPVASPTVNTVYTVTLTDANGCSISLADTVKVAPPLQITAGVSQAICPGDSVSLTSSASGGNGVYTYSWSPATGLSCTMCKNTMASPSVNTTYSVVVNDGCSTPPDTATVTITLNPLPVINFAADTNSGCAPVCTAFKNTTTLISGTITSWLWNFGNGDTSSFKTPYECFNTPGNYNVSLTAVTDKGCIDSMTVTDMIHVYSYPKAVFTMAPQPTTIINPTITFTDKSTDSYGTLSSWQWLFGDMTDATSTEENPTHTYQDTGTYCAMLTVTNIHGCKDSVTECLVISPQFTLYIPDAFSPNGDGINDIFQATGQFVHNFKMYIFDRWGSLLYYSEDINKGWNGTANGGSVVCQEDTYVYMITCDDNFGNKHSYIGKIALVK